LAIRTLLDTHILIRRLVEPNKLSRQQARLIDETEHDGHQSAVSAFSLVEIALLSIAGKVPRGHLRFLFEQLNSNPALCVLPLTTDVAREIAAMGGTLRDPADQTIVATARVHRLRLITSDQRIIDSDLVSTVE
jgi:PIN domain nuclease of toxin-antitoxin system